MEVESNAGEGEGRGQEAPESSNRKKAQGTRKRKLDSHEERTPLVPGWTSSDLDKTFKQAAMERKLLFGEIDRLTHFMKQLSDTGQDQYRSVHESIRKAETRQSLLEAIKKTGFSDA